ncbi:DUF1206 domain-containing protein [Segeticoccus rhizosphaerae]|jgi:hypothetical protein|uniref:DUF1206 domain-containing protein n=1 Tax=Segeticoccus rhizosphaerae TaxID=1104777 RepID=UPI0010BFD5D4|nr:MULTISPECIES: DUF1206 domain-containing protein [Intrasporangiaceae]
MSDVTARVEDAGDEVRDSDGIDLAARVGLVTFGVVHLVLGWLALQLAFGHRKDSASSKGAVHELAQQPWGTALVWAVAIGMTLLVIWQLVEAAVGHREKDGAGRVLHRLASVGKAIVYGAIAASAYQVALGSGSSGGGTDSATARLMDLPAGQLIVGLVALAIAAIGVGLIVYGVQDRFVEHLDGAGRRGSTGTVYRWFGRIGYCAKGVALLVVAGLFGYAAVTHEAKKSGGLDQALLTVLKQPFGPVLLALIAAGIVCYGLFCFVRARHLDS